MNTKNYSLLLMLKNFQGATEKQDENEKLTTLALQFMNMAEKIILGGYFEVNGIRRIYPLEIEFYYHEESDGGLKDPVMYSLKKELGIAKVICKPLVLVPKTAQKSCLSKLGEMAHV